MAIGKRVLVTGGAGFLGSHVCERLLQRGDDVLCVDNFFSSSRHNVAHLLGDKRMELMRHDVTFPLFVEVDEIFNLACPASPVHYQRDPTQTTKTSVIGAINMLGLAKRLKVKILQASTSEVYGDPDVHPQPEDYWGHVNPIGVRSCYDEGKRFAEAACHVYLNKYDMDLRVVRIFNTYGPRMRTDDGRVLITFVMEAINNQPFTIFGDGTQTRSFCYVSDMVEGLFKAMFTEGTKGQVFNLGNPEEYSMLDLASKIKEMTESKSEIIYKDLLADDPKQRRPDISKAERYLNWKPQVGVTEGLQKTIGYYKSL